MMHSDGAGGYILLFCVNDSVPSPTCHTRYTLHHNVMNAHFDTNRSMRKGDRIYMSIMIVLEGRTI